MSLFLVPDRQGVFHGSLDESALDREISRLSEDGELNQFAFGEKCNQLYKARFDSILEKMSPDRRKRVHASVGHGLSREVAEDLKRYNVRFDSEKERLDSDGVFMTRELSFRLSKIIEQVKVAATSYDLFAFNESVPIGAKSFKARRIEHFGEARIYRGGSSIGATRTAMYEEDFKIHHLVTSVGTDMFETMAQNFAGENITQREMAAAKEVLYLEADRLFWQGDAMAGLYGVLSYPFLPRMHLAVPFSSASTGMEIVRELNRAASDAEERSHGTMRPTACVMSHQLYNYIAQEPLDTSGGDITILEYWKRTNSQGIQNVKKVDRLTGAGPSGENGIFFYAEGSQGPLLTMPQPFAVLPPQAHGFGNTTYMYCTIGSIYMPYVGNQCLAWVPES